MQPTADEVIDGYLERLRSALRSARIETSANALSDAREFLTSELWTCRKERPELSVSDAFELVVARFGSPERVAREYLETEPPLTGFLGWYRRMSRFSYAPGWKIRCGRCERVGDYARSAPLTLRWGGRTLGRWVLGWCTECRRLRILRVYRG